MDRSEIYAGLTELIPASKRRECVARNMVEMDILLDALNLIIHQESLDLMCEVANGETY